MGSRAERECKDSSSSKGWAIAAGIACGLVGAVAGAVAHHYLTAEEEPHSSSPSHKKFTDGTCAVCMAETQELIVLPCGHEYHKACMLAMKENAQALFCPKCRQRIPEKLLSQ